MKNIVFSLFLIVLLLLSCNSSTETEPEKEEIIILNASKRNVDLAIDSMINQANLSSKIIIENDFNEIKIREELNKIMVKFPCVFEMVYVNQQGIMTCIEPTEFKDSEGSDISKQEHQIQVSTTKKYALSSLFKLVENYYAIVIAVPILQNENYLGTITYVIKPHDFISYYCEPTFKGKADDFVVMQTDGYMLYDLDASQTGKNMFTDSLYMDYPELLAAGHTIVASENGQTSYSFLNKEKNTVVTKNVWWNTSSYNGRIWKFSLIKEKN